MIYTGIGSRDAKHSLRLMVKMGAIARHLATNNHTLRSGGAEGSDTAFENGHTLVTLKNLEVFIPWKNFAKPLKSYHVWDIPYEAENIAAEIHPAWGRLTPGAKKLHTRNVCQVLGKDLKSKSDFVICWTTEGKTSGGTATAIKLALKNNVPVFNLGLPEYERMSDKEFLNHVLKEVGV